MKKARLFIVVLFIAGLVPVFTGSSMAYPPFVAKSKKFGAKDCKFCHANAEGGPPFNARGKWLISEKAKRNADAVDPEWLVDYKPKKKK